MLKIMQLSVSLGNKKILNNINLYIKSGSVHVIMGSNGSGKTTLVKTLSGHPDYYVSNGVVTYFGSDLLSLTPSERARSGVFISFQYSIEIPGVTNISFLKSSLNSIRESKGKHPLDTFDFLEKVKEICKFLDIKEDFLYRSINEGFSGGEKKKNEILQAMLLEPKLLILDEIDSGLDIDSLSVISKGINFMRSDNRSIIIITHYQKLLDYIEPDFVHILLDGSIVRTGGKSLSLEIEKNGYSFFKK
ncbi:Fe-S cluster assembly ATPase SufC [Candidatus Legionella polyplacis]|uniref:Fe-S cluster assembly ATPase SufC n=1 Tax=Candidatus Legionella polyplacis TaxID=2005262 RepID=A0ABZ2GWF9_9GAMM|nr:Fe-S cluster assembly ATPase SufC [Candidatus Legionella polyplacis]ATW01847.1 Fe-S cluster assembly ATPase SufC [Candidatus Legionella polyplacis]